MSFRGVLLLLCIPLGIVRAQSQDPGGVSDSTSSARSIALVKSARRSIDVEIYTMSDSGFRSALRERLKAGVRVRIVKEPEPKGWRCRVFAPPTLGDDSVCADEKRLLAEVRASGGEFKPFDKKRLCPSVNPGCFQHGKLIIADGKEALFSTGNFDAENYCGLSDATSVCNLDYTYLTRDPTLVAFYQRIFESDLKGLGLRGSVFQSRAEAQATVTPYSGEALLSFIRSAKSSIWLENQYITEPRMIEALAERARQQVQVRLLLASPCSFVKPDDSTKERLSRLLEPLLKHPNVTLKYFPTRTRINGRQAYLHAKAIVVDGERAWVGSVNGSAGGLFQNREFGAFLKGAEAATLAQHVRSHFEWKGNATFEEAISCVRDTPLVLPHR